MLSNWKAAERSHFVRFSGEEDKTNFILAYFEKGHYNFVPAY